jgi:hypothetical protein
VFLRDDVAGQDLQVVFFIESIQCCFLYKKQFLVLMIGDSGDLLVKITGSPIAPVRTLGSMVPGNWEALFRS